MAEVKFRDGVRDVPEHVAQLMESIETYRLTYDEAIEAANAKLLSDHLDKTLNKIVSQHFENWRRE